MTITLCINNSTMTVGLYEAGVHGLFSTVSVGNRWTEDDFYYKLIQIVAGRLPVESGPPHAIMASVSPRMAPSAAKALERICGAPPLIVGPGVKTGLDIKINDPSQLGADLVAIAAGAAAKYPLPALAINISEATTISYIDEKGRYLGTVIAAGLEPMLQSLVDNAELLPQASLASAGKVLGTSTEESMQSGLIYGLAALIDGMLARIGESHPYSTVVATGGRAAQRVLPHCKSGIVYDESLLCDGLLNIFKKQTK